MASSSSPPPSCYFTLEEATDTREEDYTDDEITEVLNILNLKIVERQAQDENCQDDQEFYPPLNTGGTGIGTGAGNENLEGEVQKWKNFSQLLERRTLQAEKRVERREHTIRTHLRWKAKAKIAGKRVRELQKKIQGLEKIVTYMEHERQEMERRAGQEGATLLMEKERLMETVKKQKTTINKAYQEKGALLFQSEKYRKEGEKLVFQVAELKQQKGRVTKDLEGKAYYLKEVERIMEQQQQVLKMSKEKHKKVKEEMQETILGLELSLASKEGEIERLMEELEGRNRRRKV